MNNLKSKIYYLKDFSNLNQINKKFKKISFVKCKIYKSNFWESFFEKVKFENCLILKSIFCDANLMNAEFTNCTIKNSNFSHSNLRGAKFSKCEFIDVNLIYILITMQKMVLKQSNSLALNIEICWGFFFGFF